jgi:hypothetical protein
LDTSGLQGIDEVEHLPLPADEWGVGLSAPALVIGHDAEGAEVLGGRNQVPWLALPAVGKDGARVQLAAAAAAARLATRAAEGGERAGQKGFACEAGFEQAGEKLLGLA